MLLLQANSIFPGDAGDWAVVHRIFDLFFAGPRGVVDACFMLRDHVEDSGAEADAGFAAYAGAFIEVWNPWHVKTFQMS